MRSNGRSRPFAVVPACESKRPHELDPRHSTRAGELPRRIESRPWRAPGPLRRRRHEYGPADTACSLGPQHASGQFRTLPDNSISQKHFLDIQEFPLHPDRAFDPAATTGQAARLAARASERPRGEALTEGERTGGSCGLSGISENRVFQIFSLASF